MLHSSNGWTEDKLLGGRVLLRQPQDGFRAAIDPVLLAAAVPAKEGERVLEIGAGTGAASLCLARRIERLTVHGLELQRDLSAAFAANAEANGLADRVRAVPGDLLRPPPIMERDSYDHAFANPPYLEVSSADPSEHAARRLASVESEADLEDWLRFGLSMIKPKGSLTLIHRADRIVEILSALRGEAGGIVLFPLWPRAGVPAKRVIVQARKGSRAPAVLSAGMVLHGEGQAFTSSAEAVLRDGSALKLT